MHIQYEVTNLVFKIKALGLGLINVDRISEECSSVGSLYYDLIHYSDVIMDPMASQITSITIVYLTVYSGADQRKHQSSASLAFVREIHRWSVNSPQKGPVTRKMFPFDDVIMPRVYLRRNTGKFDSKLHIRSLTYGRFAWFCFISIGISRHIYQDLFHWRSVMKTPWKIWIIEAVVWKFVRYGNFNRENGGIILYFPGPVWN